jgi:hypothetical protein
MNDSKSEQAEGIQFLHRQIFKRICPVCLDRLNSSHMIAHIGSCNFNGPSLSNGFLQEVKGRLWADVAKPFSRLSSMDLMSCEIIRCKGGQSLAVWVEVDLGIGGAQYLVYTERIEDYDLSQIEKVARLQWLHF